MRDPSFCCFFFLDTSTLFPATPRTAASWLSPGSSQLQSTPVHSSAAPSPATPNCLAQASTDKDRHLLPSHFPQVVGSGNTERFRQSIDIEKLRVHTVASRQPASRARHRVLLFATVSSFCLVRYHAPHHQLLLNPASNQPRPTPGISVYLTYLQSTSVPAATYLASAKPSEDVSLTILYLQFLIPASACLLSQVLSGPSYGGGD